MQVSYPHVISCVFFKPCHVFQFSSLKWLLPLLLTIQVLVIISLVWLSVACFNQTSSLTQCTAAHLLTMLFNSVGYACLLVLFIHLQRNAKKKMCWFYVIVILIHIINIDCHCFLEKWPASTALWFILNTLFTLPFLSLSQKCYHGTLVLTAS